MKRFPLQERCRSARDCASVVFVGAGDERLDGLTAHHVGRCDRQAVSRLGRRTQHRDIEPGTGAFAEHGVDEPKSTAPEPMECDPNELAHPAGTLAVLHSNSTDQAAGPAQEDVHGPAATIANTISDVTLNVRRIATWRVRARADVLRTTWRDVDAT